MTTNTLATDTLTVVLTTTDGDIRTIMSSPGTSVIDAARQAATILPSVCGQGGCGACLAQVTSGDYRTRPFSPDALGPMAGEGAVLLCCCEPTTDLEVSLPYESGRIGNSAPAERQATITGLDEVGRNIMRLRLTFEPDDVHGTAAEFDPGQFVQIEVPGSGELRAYSMANCGNWDGELEFFVHVLPGGAFSRHLVHKASVGDRLKVIGPQGAFGLAENGLRPRWFVAGGTGLAPVLSMMRRMAEWGDAQPVRLYFGVNSEVDRFAEDEIGELLDVLPDVHVTLCIWHPAAALNDPGVGPLDRLAGNGAPPANVRIIAGTTTDALVADLPTIAEPPDIYVCGPPRMVAALEVALAEAGVDPEFVSTERFAEN
jgi:ferredoxin-NADP reductase/ferredoxin